MSNQSLYLLSIIQDISYLVSVGAPSNDYKNKAGWSPKDSYEDHMIWARYYAGLIIAS